MSLPMVVQALGGVILVVLALLCYCSSACRDAQAPASLVSSSSTLPCKPQQAVPHQATARGPLQGYRLEALLGHGFFGWVYRGSAQSGAPVALKFVRDSEAGYREALLLWRLRHPAIPRLEAAFPTPDGYCLVQEYVAGETLWARLHRCGGHLPVAEVLSLGVQLAATLADLHERPQPIIHRDVKPENAMLRPDGRVKLLDFGLAVRLGGGGLVWGGTRVYMPPEQLKGRVGPRSDVYALGITLWEVLTGCLPNPPQGQFPTLPATCPLRLACLLQQMLRLRYVERPTAEEVASGLREVAAQMQAGGQRRCA